MIEIKGIHKTFGRQLVLKNIDLSLQKGACIALVGPNGCGKTTLIKSILGLVIPDCGSIEVCGIPVRDSFLYRRKIGYMPQIGRYPDNMTLGQVLELIKGVRGADQILDDTFMREYKLYDIMNKRMNVLSGGTTQKVSAALAFLFDPEIAILDEPTAGLDPVAAEIFKEKIVKEKERGKLILISSHLLGEMDDYVSEVIFMQDGTLAFHKRKDDLLEMTHELRLSSAIAKVLRSGSQ